MEPNDGDIGKSGQNRRPRRTYPRICLDTALEIAHAIRDQNAGRPMKRLLLADALKIGPMSSEFRDLLSSSSKYGLTKGNEKSEIVELTSLGQTYIKPKSESEQKVALKQAALKPELFSKIYHHFNNSKLPSESFLKNSLEREFGVPCEYAEECASVLSANGRFVGFIRDVSGSPYVMLDGGSSDLQLNGGSETETEDIATVTDEIEELPEPIQKGTESQLKRVFIAHGRNKTPLDQLKAILDKFKIPYMVAIDEPHKGRPISKKVAELMKECSSAIFIFTSDEEYISKEGSVTYKPSDNVVFELGAANVLYDNKIVIFKEDGVVFASDYSDLGYIPFEKDKLNAKSMDLLNELLGLGFLKIVPG